MATAQLRPTGAVTEVTNADSTTLTDELTKALEDQGITIVITRLYAYVTQNFQITRSVFPTLVF